MPVVPWARRSGLVLAGVVALILAVLAAPTSQAAGESYVALGDSYTSGLGTRSYIDDGTSCHRSVYAHPSLIAAQRGYTLNFRACSGATIPDVTRLQLGALSSATQYVTISVGGNDAGFADVLTECAQPWWASDCDGAIDDAQRYINNTMPGALSELYSRIDTRAPGAMVVVVGYPRLFMGKDCNAGTWFSPHEQTRLNQTADMLNSKTSAQASAAGFSFADPTSRFLGHAVCDDAEWINGLSNPVKESYHPNRPGQSSGYQPLVGPLLTGTSMAVTSRTLRAAAESAEALAAKQREYAELDASIEPKVFEAPDQTTPDAR